MFHVVVVVWVVAGQLLLVVLCSNCKARPPSLLFLEPGLTSSARCDQSKLVAVWLTDIKLLLNWWSLAHSHHLNFFYLLFFLLDYQK